MSFTLSQLVIFAARSGNVPLLEERILAGGDVNYVDPQHGSVLAEAIRCKNLVALDLLIDKGASVNVEYHDGIGPLEIALKHPNPEIVYRLVCAGAVLRKKARPHYRDRLEQCLKKVST